MASSLGMFGAGRMFWLLPDYRKLVDVGHHSCSSSFSNGIVAVEVKLRDLQSTKDLVSPAQATPRIVTVTLPTLVHRSHSAR